jgi:hypothetical protein
VGVPITGAIADRIGLQNSFTWQVLLVAATIGLAWFLPSEKEIERLAAAGEPEPSDRPREATPAAASPTSG